MKRRSEQRRKVTHTLLLLLSVATTSTSASAEDPTTPQALADSNTFRRLSDSVRALPQLGAEVARLEVGEPSLVVVARIGVSKQLEGVIGPGPLEDLRQEIRKTVASTVPLAKIQTEEALSPSAARTRARRAGLPLVLLNPTIKTGDLFLEATVTKWPRRFWRRAAAPEGVRTSALRLRVAAESIRGLFPEAKKLLENKTVTKSPIASPVAIACGDIDEDGEPDVAVIGRHSIVLGTLVGGSFHEKTRRPWNGLSNIYGAPLRSPLAAARLERRMLTVGLSDRAQTVHLDEDLRVVGYSARGYPLGGGQCLSFSPEGLTREAFDCSTPEKQPPAPGSPDVSGGDVFDAYSSTSFLTPSGVAGSTTVVLPLGESNAKVQLRLPSESPIEMQLPAMGSALASADLDGNGTVEVISSTNSTQGATDQLRVQSYREEKFESLAEQETGPIAALAVCPFDGSNPLTLVVATQEELWILR